MTTRPKQGEDQTEDGGQGNTSKLDQLEKLAAAAAQAKQWRARKNGMAHQEEPSEVRNLNHDAEARAQAEAAMQQMMAKASGRQRRR